MDETFKSLYNISVKRIMKSKHIPFHKKKEYLDDLNNYHKLVENG